MRREGQRERVITGQGSESRQVFGCFFIFNFFSSLEAWHIKNSHRMAPVEML